MARKRTIDQSAILDAVEAVVGRDGVVELTIDAVAREAGISKASVIYDYRSKDGLIGAYVKRQIDRERAAVAEMVTADEGRTDAFILSLLDIASRKCRTDGGAARCFAAAMKNDAGLREMMRVAVAEDLASLAANSSQPVPARLAFLALHGLMSLEYLELHNFDEATRQEILDDLARLAQQGICNNAES